MYGHGEAIGIYRGGVLVAQTRGGFDPYENRLILNYGTDVAAGDVATFRGFTRRVTGEPLVWRSPFTGWEAGVMAPVEAGPVLMPDLGRINRPGGQPVINETTGTLTYPEGDLLWTGPVLVEPGIGQGTNTDLMATQRISNMTHVATVPLTCIDVMPDDVLRVTSSRDQRLITRDLVVIGVRLTSSGLTRDLLVRDNQG